MHLAGELGTIHPGIRGESRFGLWLTGGVSSNPHVLIQRQVGVMISTSAYLRVAGISLRLAVACVSLFVSQSVLGQSGHVIFGSWLDPDYARMAEQQLAQLLDIEVSTTPTTVAGQVFVRLQSTPISSADGRRMIARAQQRGWPAAWFAPQAERATPSHPSHTSHTEEDTPSQSAVQSGAPVTVAAAGREHGGIQVDAEIEDAEKDAEKEGAEQDTPSQSALQSGARVAVAAAGGEQGVIQVTYLNDVDIKLDGHVDEAVWQQLPVYDEMKVIDPDSMVSPRYATQTRMFFTDRGLYVSAQMEQPADTLVARLSSRDQFINRDAYGVTIDTSGEGLYGYWFKVNLGGSLMDGRVVPERTFTEQWDGPWQGESQRTPQGWSVEMFLPWSMMALPEGQGARQVGIWIDRKVAHADELYGWPALPFTEPRFMSALQPLALPDLKNKSQLAVFPFISATHDAIDSDNEYRVGADVAWRPTPNNQITATLNPDFGAVESDAVVVNLTAFEVFFPEKRLFFLEGTEVFVTTPRSDLRRFRSTRRGSGARATPKTFTPEPTTLLNTRRIGGHPVEPQPLPCAGADQQVV